MIFPIWDWSITLSQFKEFKIFSMPQLGSKIKSRKKLFYFVTPPFLFYVNEIGELVNLYNGINYSKIYEVLFFVILK